MTKTQRILAALAVLGGLAGGTAAAAAPAMTAASVVVAQAQNPATHLYG
jgi:hypothetical protein